MKVSVYPNNENPMTVAESNELAFVVLDGGEELILANNRLVTHDHQTMVPYNKSLIAAGRISYVNNDMIINFGSQKLRENAVPFKPKDDEDCHLRRKILNLL